MRTDDLQVNTHSVRLDLEGSNISLKLELYESPFIPPRKVTERNSRSAELAIWKT